MKQTNAVRGRGSAACWTLVTLPAVLGLVSLSVDFGRVLLAKAEFQAGMDAASRFAVTGLSDGTAADRAIAAAKQNRVMNRSLVLTSTDVALGKYDATTHTFTANGLPSNAIRVSKRLSGTNGVPLSFASFFGISSIDLSAVSGAYVSGSTGYTGGLAGFVGTDYFNINGGLSVRAWDSSTQKNAEPTSWAVGQTQGNINLNSGVLFQGEIQHPSGGSVSMNQATVTKGITTLAGPLSYATPTTPAGTVAMGNYNGPTGSSQTFTAGTYAFDTFNVPNGKTVVFSGPVQLFVNGSCNIAGAITTYQNVPGNLKVNIVSGAGGDIGANTSALYMDLYAPASPFNLNARTFYGSLITKGVNVNSTFTMNIDRYSFDSKGLPQPTGSGSMTIHTIALN